MGNLARGIFGWGKRTSEILGQDAAEYLQEESRELPNRREVDGFLKNIGAHHVHKGHRVNAPVG